MVERAGETLWPSGRTALLHGEAPRVVADLILARTSRLLRACAVLASSGYAGESAGLVRSTWEDAVSIAFVAESPSDRATQWIDFSEKRRIHRLNRALEDPRALDSQVVDSARDAAAAQEASHGHWWSGMGPTRMAAKLAESTDVIRARLARDFDMMYQDFCDDAHGSPIALDNLLSADGHDATLTVGPEDGRVADLAALAIYAGWHVAYNAHVLGAHVDVAAIRSVLDEAHVLVRETSSWQWHRRGKTAAVR